MVGEYIRSLRAAAGLTQRQLAAAVGISPSLLSHVESGRREPTIRSLRAISRALGIPSAALFAVALDDDLAVESTSTEKHRAMNEEMLAAVQHSIVLRRLRATRDNK